jgi:hypothetical protein
MAHLNAAAEACCAQVALGQPSEASDSQGCLSGWRNGASNETKTQGGNTATRRIATAMAFPAYSYGYGYGGYYRPYCRAYYGGYRPYVGYRVARRVAIRARWH